jgi:hypothetical protein
MMLKSSCTILLIAAMLVIAGYPQPIAIFEVKLPDHMQAVDVTVSVNLDEVTFLPDSTLTLVQPQENGLIPVPFQIQQGPQRTLHWLLQPGTYKQKKCIFHLIKSKAAMPVQIEATAQNGALTIHSGDRHFLRYHYATVYPPAGVDSAYKRSGFIHPLWSPHGQELTRIQPPDHYHHYGIWNPWTHVLFEGDTLDFWNLAKREGTVRFTNFISVIDGAVFSEFEALHEHVVFKKNGIERIAFNELQSVRVYQPQIDQDVFMVDITIQLCCAWNNPVKLLEYRYGGLGWRTTEQWHKNNSSVLTSEGKTRKEADGSLARWCIVQGAVDGDHAGVVMMSYPGNYNHPEPLRIWPENIYERGDLFANFSPTKNKDWLLMPGKKHVLKYRLLVFNGEMGKERAERAWQAFAAPPEVVVKQ